MPADTPESGESRQPRDEEPRVPIVSEQTVYRVSERLVDDIEGFLDEVIEALKGENPELIGVLADTDWQHREAVLMTLHVGYGLLMHEAQSTPGYPIPVVTDETVSVLKVEIGNFGREGVRQRYEDEMSRDNMHLMHGTGRIMMSDPDLDPSAPHECIEALSIMYQLLKLQEQRQA